MWSNKKCYKCGRIIIRLVHGKITLTISIATSPSGLEVEQTLFPWIITMHPFRRLQRNLLLDILPKIIIMFAYTFILSHICFTFNHFIVDFGVCKKMIVAMSPSSLMIFLPYVESCKDSRGHVNTYLLPYV